MNYPHDRSWQGPRPLRSDLHETAGLPNNWALDFMAAGGTRVITPERVKMTRLSGHDPRIGVIEGDIFGWNIYLETLDGHIEYFITHLGNRCVGYLNKVLDAGTIIGHVGHWPNDPSRSHSHIGVTHYEGKNAACDHICAVAQAPRITGHWRKKGP